MEQSLIKILEKIKFLHGYKNVKRFNINKVYDGSYHIADLYNQESYIIKFKED